jgi:hypothetical protein
MERRRKLISSSVTKRPWKVQLFVVHAKMQSSAAAGVWVLLLLAGACSAVIALTAEFAREFAESRSVLV